jgi:outer membrane protein assembly factor BamB
MRIRAIAGGAFLAMFCMFAGACNKSGIDPNLPAITTQPADATAKAGSTATFTVVASGQAPLAYQWFVFSRKIAGATSASYTTGTLAISDNNSFYFCLVTNSVGSIESNEALLTVTATSPNPGIGGNTLGNANPADVLTLHNDAARTGQYLGETLLTPANVNSTKFGKLGTVITDGPVDAQPLYASGVTLPSGDVRNVLYAATEHGSVYAFDAATGSVIWQRGLVGANEQPASLRSCTDDGPERGITATPVIDRTRGPHGAIYVITNTKNGARMATQRIHALDIATGYELFDGPTPISASAAGVNGNREVPSENFDAGLYQPLAGLQLSNGKIYAAWAPNFTSSIPSGWIIGFDASTLNIVDAIYLGSISSPSYIGLDGTGLSADGNGYFYLYSGAITTPIASSTTTSLSTGGFGNAFLKISTEQRLMLANISSTTGTLMNTAPGQDASTGGVIVLPDFKDASGRVLHLVLGAGNDANIYVLDRDSLGSSGLQASAVYQETDRAFASTRRTNMPAYSNDLVYYAADDDVIRAFAINNGRLSPFAVSQSERGFGSAGATIAVSANGNSSGILWAVAGDGTGILRAYDAADLSRELYDSAQAPNSNAGPAAAGRAVLPTVAGGHVYVATKDGIVVFGLIK